MHLQPRTTSWQPNVNLPYGRSSHPLDVALTTFHIDLIRQYSQQPAETAIAYSKQKPSVVISAGDLQNLLSHGQPINDDTIYLFLELYCTYFDYTFLTEKFTTIIQRDGWNTIITRYLVHSRSQRRSTTKPFLHGEPAIAIRCFVNGCHWVGVVRR